MNNVRSDAEIMRGWQKSPRAFIRDIWKLTPERDNTKFIKGKHISWQQDDILQAVEDAVAGKKAKRISIKAGHGIGKTTVLAWLVIWYLVCFKESQVPCTAPTSDQMHDVLWKELNKWLNKMPPAIGVLLEWQTGYLRVTARPETWFARAKTAKKEAPEALAGVHGDHVMFIIDEASGVPDEVYNTAEGALTSGNILVIMISNPTRLLGYFFASHNSDRSNWQCLSFSAEQSPLVDATFVARIIEKHGIDSDEYRIRVLGEFPKADSVDAHGYLPLLVERDIRTTNDGNMGSLKRMGVDPAGQGKDVAAWVIRDNYKAKIVGEERMSDPMSVASKTRGLLEFHEVSDYSTTVDNFGVGANVATELAKDGCSVRSVNVGEQAEENDRFINKRAEAYWRMKEWLRQGGELVAHPGWSELLGLRYRRETSNKIKIMGKEEMRKAGIASPNFADALMLTFVDGEEISDAPLAQPFSATSYL